MNRYVTGATIRRLREEKKLTQAALAEQLFVSDKAVSKWETGKGLPDITLLEPLAKALGVSVAELLSGQDIRNRNRSFNLKRSRIYVCPICGNILIATGEAAISCCGVELVAEEAEEPDGAHTIAVERVEDEYYVNLNHPMTREHHISFLAALRDDRIELVKLYPEGEAAARFKLGYAQTVYACCNRHGLFQIKLK